MRRRELLAAAAMLPWSAFADEKADIAALLRAGGTVIAFRHALAPGTYDPPGFQLGDCSTQRNLDTEGRSQAQRIGNWFRQQSLKPAVVRSSPWCRCTDTAHLAFGGAEKWPALGSPHAGTETVNDAALLELRRALVAVTAQPGRFEAWVTHGFVLSRLVGVSAASGEGVLLASGGDGLPRLLGRLVI